MRHFQVGGDRKLLRAQELAQLQLRRRVLGERVRVRVASASASANRVPLPSGERLGGHFGVSRITVLELASVRPTGERVPPTG